MDHQQGYSLALSPHLFPDKLRLGLVGGHHAVVGPVQSLFGLLEIPFLS